MTDGPEDDYAETSRDFVQSLARGLGVIRAFDADHSDLTLSDVARRTGMTRAATRRFLLTLSTMGYVRATSSTTGGSATFALTPRVLELGFSYLSALSLPEIVQPHLKRLSREVDESVSAAVLDGTDIVYIARVPTRRIMNVRITIGTRFPSYATAMGRVLLAGMADADADAAISESRRDALTDLTITDAGRLRDEVRRTREQGWAFVDGELEAGLRSIAVPLHTRDGGVVAAVNISTSAMRDSVEHIQTVYLPRLLTAAEAIEKELRNV